MRLCRQIDYPTRRPYFTISPSSVLVEGNHYRGRNNNNVTARNKSLDSIIILLWFQNTLHLYTTRLTQPTEHNTHTRRK